MYSPPEYDKLNPEERRYTIMKNTSFVPKTVPNLNSRQAMDW